MWFVLFLVLASLFIWAFTLLYELLLLLSSTLILPQVSSFTTAKVIFYNTNLIMNSSRLVFQWLPAVHSEARARVYDMQSPLSRVFLHRSYLTFFIPYPNCCFPGSCSFLLLGLCVTVSSLQNALHLRVLLTAVWHFPLKGGFTLLHFPIRKPILIVLENDSFYCVSLTYICSIMHMVSQWFYLSLPLHSSSLRTGNDSFSCYF